MFVYLFISLFIYLFAYLFIYLLQFSWATMSKGEGAEVKRTHLTHQPHQTRPQLPGESPESSLLLRMFRDLIPYGALLLLGGTTFFVYMIYTISWVINDIIAVCFTSI